MMICPYCHRETDEGSVFCGRCGADLRAAQKTAAPAAAPSPAVPGADKREAAKTAAPAASPGPAGPGATPGEAANAGQKKKSRVWVWAVLGVVVLAVAALVVRMVLAEAARQRVEESDLRYLVRTIDESEAPVEDFFDYLIRGWSKTYSISGDQDRYTELSLKANKAAREYMFAHSTFLEMQERKGWDPAAYAPYEELWEAYKALYQYIDDYDSSDHQAVRDTYESLRSAYQSCRDRLP